LGGNRRSRKGTPTEWDHEDIPDFEWEEKKKKGQGYHIVTYQILQLLNSRELTTEGKRLQHCVSSYAWSCANGQRSVWSVRKLGSGESWEPLGTIELNTSNKTVVQFRAKKNSLPGAKAQSLMEKWITKNGLKKSRWI
jgi:hypothetical protein